MLLIPVCKCADFVRYFLLLTGVFANKYICANVCEADYQPKDLRHELDIWICVKRLWYVLTRASVDVPVV